MILGLDIRAAVFNAFWRFPETDTSRLYDFATYATLARAAEQACMHFLFDADSVAVENLEPPPRAFEPTVFFSALAAVTSRIGLLPTYSTTFNEPFNLARRIASLDHLSKGRAGWNIVTTYSAAAAGNFGLETLPQHDERYERATEFVDVVRRLCTSWDADAIVADKASGRFVEPSRVHPINFEGRYFKVRGPLTTFRPPQSEPIVSQAGESEAGRKLAGRFADLVYTRQNNLDAAISYRRDLATQAEANGRPPGSVKLMQAVFGAIADSDWEAEDHMRRLSELAPEGTLFQRLKRELGVDLSSLSENDPLPPLSVIATSTNFHTYLARLHKQIADENIVTVGDLIASTKRRERFDFWVGSAKSVADRMEEWFVSGGVDGFILGHGDQTKFGAWAVFNKLVPELQRRKLFRDGYTGLTFRENLGLARIP